MKIGALAQKSGLSVYTIRYYERIGLLPYAFRDPSGRRDYGEDILVWIEFLSRLKATGMPVRDMLRYSDLRQGGKITDAERCNLLVEHRQKVSEHISELQYNLLVLDAKISGYASSIGEDEDDDAPKHTARK